LSHTRLSHLRRLIIIDVAAVFQAALSTVALDYVRLSGNRGEFDDAGGDTDYATAEDRAIVVLTVAVLSIILTAPLFAVCMKYAGENWLVKSEVKFDDKGDIETHYDGDQTVTIEMAVGSRKESISSSLGNTTIDFGANDVEAGGRMRGLSITSSKPTPPGLQDGYGFDVSSGRVRSLSSVARN
jgi:hypothetical protein